MSTFHPHLETPPYLPALVPLPPSLTGSQLLTLAAVLHCSRDRDGECVAPPTLRDIAQSLGVRFKASANVKADLLALVEMGRIEIDQCVNAKLWKITDLGRWHFPPHMRSGLNGDARRYARAALAKEAEARSVGPLGHREQVSSQIASGAVEQIRLAHAAVALNANRVARHLPKMPDAQRLALRSDMASIAAQLCSLVAIAKAEAL